MGQKIMSDALIFVSFTKAKAGYSGLLSVNGLFQGNENVEEKLKEASATYGNAISEMTKVKDKINSYKTSRKPIPARLIWNLGNAIFGLVDDLSRLSFQIDGIYGHLERDLDSNRKWLEKVIIVRRYVPAEDMIPRSLNWGKLEKGTKRKVLQIQKGILNHD